ncbi:hypothetical protein [Armatimonas sp.]|uniref:hypothetical protein n=1 Tax=Armatimonas sp. TaxID=1872638 RepID=UPI003752B675
MSVVQQSFVDQSKLCRIYSRSSTAIQHLFSEAPVWSKLGETSLVSTVCPIASILSQEELTKGSVAVVPADQWITAAASGVVDFFPDRVKIDGKYQMPEKWKNATVADLRQEVAKKLRFTRWGVYSYFGRLAVRVVVPKEEYGKVTTVARALQLQIERVSSSPICVAQLTIRNVSGITDAVPLRVYLAQRRVESTYPVSWGKVVSTESETTVLAYIPVDLTAKDHFSEMTDGVRTIFTPMLAPAQGAAAEVTERTKKVHDAWVPVTADDIGRDGEKVLSDSEAGADEDMAPDERDHARALTSAAESLKILNEAIDSQKRALRKTTGSWKAYNLGAEAQCAALDVLEEIRKESMRDLDEAAAETFAAWLNACPSPARILEKATVGAAEKSQALMSLERALTTSAKPPKASALSELNATARHAAGGGRLSYAAAARSSHNGGADKHRGRR